MWNQFSRRPTLLRLFQKDDPNLTIACVWIGVFLKRQPIVSQVFAEMAEKLFLNPTDMWVEVRLIQH